LQQAGIAVFSYPEDAARSLAALSRFSQSPRSEFKLNPKKLLISKKARKEVIKIFDQARTLKITHLPEFLSLPILKAYSLPVADFFLIKNEQDAKIAKKRFSMPLALKIASLDILHKSDVQGIILNVQPQDVPRAYSQLLARVKKNCPQARIEGVLATPMAAAGITELIIGGLRDINLGPALMLGWGGIYAETLNDVAFGLSPITREKMGQMFASLRVKAVLTGARGGKKADLKALADILLRLDVLLRDFPEIKELDLNPVIARERGALILDARLSLSN
jgi:acyl-CoA synthetase (NDP forming)